MPRYVLDFGYRQTLPHRNRTLYFIRNTDTGRVKIGIATDLRQRLRDLENSSGSRMELIGSLPNGSDLECVLHVIFREFRVRGEWFEPTPILLQIAASPTCDAIMELARKREADNDLRLMENRGFIIAYPWKER